MADGDSVRIGQNNFGSTQTLLQATVNAPDSVFLAQVGGGFTGDAIAGLAGPGIGVVGDNRSGGQPGVLGRSAGGIFGGVMGSSPAIGVRGHGSTGVVGQGDTGIGGLAFGPSGVGGRGDVIDQLGQDTGGAGLIGTAEASTGVVGIADTGVGVRGTSNRAAGVTGRSDEAPGVDGSSRVSPGVVGRSDLGVGVVGVAQGTGVEGSGGSRGVSGFAQSASGGVGVQGFTNHGIGVDGIATFGTGVFAVSSSGSGVIAYGTEFGVFGTCSPGVGVHGDSMYGPAGVHGTSPGRIGVFGETEVGWGVAGSGGDGIGVMASAQGTQPALVAQAGRGPSALLDGDVVVTGGLTVAGVKSAAVRHPDGTLRRLACLEAPESLFEDFGEAELENGNVEVRLDPNFAALVDVDSYQVFVTSYAPVPLYVSRRDREAFEVRVAGDARPADGEPVRCGWRVVARRVDVAPVRLPVVEELEGIDVATELRRGPWPEVPRAEESSRARYEVSPVPPEPWIPPPSPAREAQRADEGELGG